MTRRPIRWPSSQLRADSPTKSITSFKTRTRVLGTNNVDLCSRLCHAASVSGLKSTLGHAAPRPALSPDFIGTDLLVIFGSDLATNQPVTTKYMHYAKKAGTRIVVVGSRCASMARSATACHRSCSSAVFDTKLLDDFFQSRGSAATSRLSTV